MNESDSFMVFFAIYACVIIVVFLVWEGRAKKKLKKEDVEP